MCCFCETELVSRKGYSRDTSDGSWEAKYDGSIWACSSCRRVSEGLMETSCNCEESTVISAVSFSASDSFGSSCSEYSVIVNPSTSMEEESINDTHDSTGSNSTDDVDLGNKPFQDGIGKMVLTASTSDGEGVNSPEIINVPIKEAMGGGMDDADVDLNCSAFWDPPEPDNPDDEVDGCSAGYDEDDDYIGEHETDPSLGTSADSFNKSWDRFGSGYNSKEKKSRAMGEVMNGKFRAFVAYLCNSFGVSVGEDDSDKWVDVVTNLTWEAASYVKPTGKAMDVDGFLKVKCIASGSRSESKLIKGLVFKKHAAHKHMPTSYENPRLLLVRGMLGQQSNGLSSFDLMEQEKSHLKSVTEMIEAYNPNVVLVEKTVSRDLQEFLLTKRITLVFDMKLHRLERVARYTGSSILSPESFLVVQSLKQCEHFHFVKFTEELTGSADSGKIPSKTLMFLEGCPTRLGCTVLVRGSHSGELKQIKCVVQYAFVMAYHLILETSFLVDQRAMLCTTPFIELENVLPSDKQSIGIPNEDPSFADLDSLEASIRRVLGDRLSLSSGSCPSLSVYFGLDAEAPVLPFSGESSPSYLLEATRIEEDGDRDFESPMAHGRDDGDVGVMLDSQSILVLMSSRNATRGAICEQSHFSHIKFYKNFDVPLGRFLRDNLLNQTNQCMTCGEPPPSHSYYYAHHKKQLTIRVRQIPVQAHLPGEARGKLWMWSRCTKCKTESGVSKPTKRVVISAAARRLSFGKFLDISFSLGSSVMHSNCGHSLDKDFLYFFGMGSTAAMFRYSSLPTYTVVMPQPKLQFANSFSRGWLDIEVENVKRDADSLFLEVEAALQKIESASADGPKNTKEASALLKREISDFEVKGDRYPTAQMLLYLNHLRWELFLEACLWDLRLSLLSSSSSSSWTKPSADQVDITTETGEESVCVPEPSRNVPEAVLSDLVWSDFRTTGGGRAGEYFRDRPSRGASPHVEEFIRLNRPRLRLSLGDGLLVSDYEDEVSSVIACSLARLGDAADGPPHADVSLSGLAKYSVASLHAARFRELRRLCGVSHRDYVASLSRCRAWDPKGGKSRAPFSRTLDGRLIIKEIRRAEVESFLKFAPEYFKYVTDAVASRNPTCLARILGIYQVRNGRETRQDVAVMENLMWGRRVTRQYDLKGALHARFNDPSPSEAVLLDQNFVNDMNASPIYMSHLERRMLHRGVWNDTGFLNSVNVMDYSLLVGVDGDGMELVCGIIDYLRQYTWDKQLETWVKASLVVPKHMMPTVISPIEYKKRFRKFMATHFLSVPDHWCSSSSQ